MRNGCGTSYYMGLQQYEGEWQDNKYNNFGTLYEATDLVKVEGSTLKPITKPISGIWKDGKFIKSITYHNYIIESDTDEFSLS
jgi:hypothetical protein